MALLDAINRLSIWTKHKLHMAHTISQERAQFLEEHFSGFGFKDSTPDKRLFETITSLMELHYLAHIYNWDAGPEVLSWIINSPHCDQGTAALIFWRSQPDFYQEYTDESQMSLQDGVLPLLQSIMGNWERGFYQQQIAYDRHEDPAAGKLYPDNPREKWPVPAYLLTPTKGKPFLFA
ncbi:DUF4274 domain-containing protein [Hymenobacter monticola]|uniref:DUF4274 domain-containing protein n=1 Tax=Hymenobacter monticola TaxID=1705399 RepID=A0ABY4B4S2_9BACT|nr:DUF4274 domain-containing protein [Hymenobacter monticola]UOE34133.1 DUF4274 domain-containing protein [Hymenobacter monticola]